MNATCRVAAVVFLGFSVCLLFARTAVARVEIEGVYVFSEKTDDADRACGVTKEGAVAAVESVLRANRIKILPKSTLNSISAYVRIHIIRLRSGLCVGRSALEFRIFSTGIYGKDKIPLSGYLMLCDPPGILFTDPDISSQETINNFLRTSTEICISEVEKLDQ